MKVGVLKCFHTLNTRIVKNIVITILTCLNHSKRDITWCTVLCWFYRPTREFFHYRWRAANFDTCSALLDIEQWGFLSVPRLFWHGMYRTCAVFCFTVQPYFIHDGINRVKKSPKKEVSFSWHLTLLIHDTYCDKGHLFI